jgi:hypothetical protein
MHHTLIIDTPTDENCMAHYWRTFGDMFLKTFAIASFQAL